MNRKGKTTRHRLLFSAALLALNTIGPGAVAQFQELAPTPGHSEWSMAIPRLRYLETEVDAEWDTYQSPGQGGRTSADRLYVSPRIGLEWKNYIYHPDLLTYSLLFEPGYVWQRRNLGNQGNQSDELTLNGNYTANILQLKPYATSASYSRSHDQVKYDFFNTATVDAEGWGAASGYHEGPVPVTVSYHQSHEDSSDFNQNTITDQRSINVDARNERRHEDVTQLTYEYSQYDRESLFPGSTFDSQNTYHHVALLDTEHFEKSLLRSTFRFNDRETQGAASTDLNAAANYNVDHSSTLHSYYDLSFSRFTATDSESLQSYADAGIRHQLYESLASGLELHGSTLDSSSSSSSLDSYSGGATASADYTKHLGDWGRLNLDNSTSYNWTEQQRTGSELFIANEPHTVPNNGLVRLNQPRVLAVISVTDANNLPLQAGLDYTLIQFTDPWQIQIISVGPGHIQPGSGILVTYTVQSNPSGNFSILANQFQVRLSFWHEMAAVFARYSFSDSHASSPEFLLQNDEILQTGAELTWRRLRLYGDYIDQHSTLYNNRTFNLAESYSLDVASDVTLGIDLNQQWSDNSFQTETGTNLTQHMTFYNYMLHLEWRPAPALNWTAEIGYRQQRGLGLNEDLFAARSYLNWRLGKLQLHLGYEHEFQDIVNTTRARDFVFLRAKREF